MKRLIAGVEILLLFNLILFQIWIAPYISPILIGMIATVIIGSWIAHGDSPKELGLYPIRAPAIKQIVLITGWLVAVISIIGFIYNPLWYTKISISEFIKEFMIYCGWAFVQQVALNSFVAHRFFQLTRNLTITIFLSSFLFAVVHAPNIFVMVMTFLMGIACVSYFIRFRSVYPLAFAHAAIAMTVGEILPIAWHHNLIIGPRFF